MKKYQVRFEKKAQKALKNLDRQYATIILAWINKNLQGTTNPCLYGKALAGNRAGSWRYRIGDYRLLAYIDDKEVIILLLKIGHRQDIYQ